VTDSSGSRPRGSDRPRRGLRGRVTGRAVVLVLVCLMLAVSFASSLKAYVQQRSQIQALKTEIAQRHAAIEDLESEKARWQDPFFVGQQARERFGYLLPGERSFVVLDADGQPLESEAELADPETAIRTTPTPWWDGAWASVTLAGHPPEQVPQQETVPPDEIPFEEDALEGDGQ
jgi:cell division protein FtsB